MVKRDGNNRNCQGNFPARLSVALNRRHLSEGQKAALMVEYADSITERHNKEKSERANDIKYNHKVSLSKDGLTQGEQDEGAWKQAQEKFGMSTWQMRTAKEIEKEPVVFTKMKNNELSFNEAKFIVRQPDEKRTEILQKKEAESKAGMKAINARWHGNEYDEASVSQSNDEEQERSRKLAAEHMHVSEWKVREVQGIFA